MGADMSLDKNYYKSEQDLPAPSVSKSENEWKQILTDQQFQVCRKQGTERAFWNAFYKHKESGIYKCIACDNSLFTSKEKYDSGTGWPSFWAPANENSVIYVLEKTSATIPRVEVKCKQCHSHLGHIFSDGPKDKTGKRYCINSVCLKFEKE